jgi:hypothetical protein
MGALDKYAEVFDIAKYKSRREETFLWLLQTKDKEGDDAAHAKLVYDYAIRIGFVFPKESVSKYERKKIIQKVKACLKKVKRVWNEGGKLKG